MYNKKIHLYACLLPYNITIPLLLHEDDKIEDIQHLAELSAWEFSDDRLESFKDEFNNILKNEHVKVYTIFLSGIPGTIILTSTPLFEALINALIISVSIIK